MAGSGKLLWIVSVAAAAIAVTGSEARGDSNRNPDKTVAMMAAQVSGDADPALRTQLQEAVRRGLKAAGYSLVDRDELRSELDDQALMDCTSTTCLAQISDAVGAMQFLRASVEASGAAYKIELGLIDVRGASLRKLEESCAVCTILELTDVIARVAEALMTTREQKPTPVVIVTQPQGAALQLDGKAVGLAPFTAAVTPGKHRITAHLAGHTEVDQEIDVTVAEAQQRFEIIMVPVTEPRHGQDRARRFRWWKYVAGGGAISAVVAGGYLISLHHDGKCDSPTIECKDRYNTLGGGIMTIGLGAALAAASGWMFLRDSRSSHEAKARASLAPTPGGAYATVRLRF